MKQLIIAKHLMLYTAVESGSPDKQQCVWEIYLSAFLNPCFPSFLAMVTIPFKKKNIQLIIGT